MFTQTKQRQTSINAQKLRVFCKWFYGLAAKFFRNEQEQVTKWNLINPCYLLHLPYWVLQTPKHWVL